MLSHRHPPESQKVYSGSISGSVSTPSCISRVSDLLMVGFLCPSNHGGTEFLNTMSNNDDLQRAVDQIHVSEAVVLLGAGTSYQAGMPLARQLSPLVWHALDTNPDVLRRLASIFNVPHASAKDVVGDNVDRIRLAFAQITADPLSRRAFQLAFTNLNRDKSRGMSRPHDALVRLVYTKHVMRVVSLNWDTLLEAAFARRYGAGINAQGRLLFKSHGDCEDPDTNLGSTI